MMLVFLHDGFWVLAPILQVCLLALMVRRGLRREFPLFFSYTIFSIISFGLQLTLYHVSYRGYFYAYWTTAAISVGLGFTVMHEVFQHVFRPYDSLRELGSILFKWTALVLLLVALVNAALMTERTSSRLIETILVLDRSVRVMQCGLVLFLVLFAGYVGLTSRSHIFGIALGFGTYAAVDLMVATVLATAGPASGMAMSLAKAAAYSVACATWFSFLRAPEPARLPVDQRARGAEWNHALGSMTQSRESFLPMIESAVERVLQRRDRGGTGLQKS